MQDLLPNKNARRKSARGKVRNKKKNPRGNSRRASARALERRSLAVYDGQNWLGNVEQIGGQFTARTIKNKKIAVFGSLKAAADAVSDTSEAA
jgi:hypothetical protein